MSAVYFPTRRGLRARIARWFELLNVSATLHYAERDREFLASQLESLPAELRQKDLDIDTLRLRQAMLRGSR